MDKAAWADLIEEAEKLGYDPAKEAKVIALRDNLINQKTKLEIALQEATSRSKTYEDSHNELSTKYENDKKELLKQLKEKEKRVNELTEQFGDLDVVRSKLSKYEQIEIEKKSAIEVKYNDLINTIKQQDESILDLIPEYDDLEKKVNWIEKNMDRLKVVKPVIKTNDAPPKDTTDIPDFVKEYAKRGISEEFIMKNEGLYEKAKKEWKNKRS